MSRSRYWSSGIAAACLVFGAGTVSAQDIEDFTLGSEAARNAKTRDEISLATARRIADHCLEQAAERGFGKASSF